MNKGCLFNICSSLELPNNNYFVVSINPKGLDVKKII